MNSHECDANDSRTPLGFSRRDLLASAAVAAAASVLGGCAGPRREAGAEVRPEEPVPGRRYAGRVVRPERLRIGVIGCGGRGTGAAINAIQADSNVEIYALGDLFEDRVASSAETIAKDHAANFNVPPERQFAGFEAYRAVCALPVDVVILAAPPGFRPPHFAAAIAAGKHVFMEKPVGVCPAGIRTVIASAREAQLKGLSVVAGTQRRHDPAYCETMRRIRDGALGELVAGQCYWNQGGLWKKDRQPGWSDMEWQCRNWLYFTWLSGDHIVEQHVHNLDVINWAMGSPPASCIGMGGRQARIDPVYGNIYDHFAIEYLYPNGARVTSMCRQTPGASERVAEYLVGTRGTADPKGTIVSDTLFGPREWKYEPRDGKWVDPYIQEHADLLHAVRTGRPINEGERVAHSTLTAIMGRMSAYTGREVSWEWVLNSSQLNLCPGECVMGQRQVEEVAVPGVTKLV